MTQRLSDSKQSWLSVPTRHITASQKDISATYQLKQQARGMGKAQAARLYETYTGPFAGETEKERLKRASYLREQSKK